MTSTDPAAAGTRAGGDSTAERDLLARKAFSREGTAADRSELAAFDARRAAERDRDAAAAGPLPHPPADGAPIPTGVSAAVGSAPTQHERASRPPVRILAVVTAAVIAALVMTVAVLGDRVATSDAVIAGSASAGTPDPLSRFDVAQDATDVPAVALPYDYEKSSVRRLLEPEQTDLTDYVLYGARTDRDLVCLVLVFPDDATASSCVSVSEFRQHGIRVSANVLRRSPVAEGLRVPVAHTVTWQSDDRFEFSSSLAEAP